MAGSKYLIEMNVSGNAEKKLGDIDKSIGRVQGSATRLRDAFGRSGGGGKGGKGGDPIEQIAGNTKIAALHGLHEEIEKLSTTIDSFNDRIIGAGTETVKAIVNDAASFEDAAASMKFAFGKDWENVMSQVKSDSARLTFTFQETVQLAASLGRMHINPFGGMTKESQEFKSKTGEMIRAMDVLQDTADAAGKGATDVVISIRNALAGDWTSLQRRLDIPLSTIKEMKKEVAAASNKQEQFNAIVRRFAADYGGAGALKAQNYNKAIAQIPDMLQQLRAGIGAEGLKFITKSVLELVESLHSLVENKQAMEGLSRAFQIVAKVIATIISIGAKLIGFIERVIEKAPWLPIMAMGFTLIALAVSLTVGATLGLVGAVVALAIAFSLLDATMIPVILLGVIAMAALSVAIVVGVGVMAIFAKVAMDVAGGANRASASLDNLKLVFQGVYELVTSFSGATSKMSLKTYENLRKAGLLDFVTKVGQVFHTLYTAYNAFMDTIDDLSNELGPDFLSLFDAIKTAVMKVATVLGYQFSDATKGTSKWADGAKTLARSLGSIVSSLVRVTTSVINFVNESDEFAKATLAVTMLVKAVYYGVVGFGALLDKLKEFIRIKDALMKGGVKGAVQEMRNIEQEKANRNADRMLREENRRKDREERAKKKREEEVAKTYKGAAGPVTSGEAAYIAGDEKDLRTAKAREKGRVSPMEDYWRTGMLPGAAGPPIAPSAGAATAGPPGAAPVAAADPGLIARSLTPGFNAIVAALNALNLEVKIGDDVIASAVHRANTGVGGV